MGLPKHLSSLGVGEPTWRDRQRELQKNLLATMWAKVDADNDDPRGEPDEPCQPGLR